MKPTRLNVKVFFVVVSFLQTVSVCYSQTISLGVQAGINLSRLNGAGSGYLTEGGLTAFQGGVFGLFQISKIGIQPEVNFIQQGTVVELIGSEATIKLNYLCVPLMLKFFPKNNHFYIQAGPQIGFLTSYEDKERHIWYGFKNSNTSLNFGLGIVFPVNVLLDIRYSLGLSQISKSNDEQINTRTIMLSIGYKINFGKR